MQRNLQKEERFESWGQEAVARPAKYQAEAHEKPGPLWAYEEPSSKR